jgi:hypothetical protein
MGHPTFHELMAALLGDPRRFPELAPQIGNFPMVRVAEHRTPYWVVRKKGAVDIDATLAFLGQLGQPAFRVTRRFDGGTTATLAVVCGITTFGVVHPATLAEVIGKDDADVDWTGQPPAVLRALIWGHATGHSAWPAGCDEFRLADEIVNTETLSPRWRRIIDDFERVAMEEDLQFSVMATPATMTLIRMWRGDRADTQQTPPPTPAPASKFNVNITDSTGVTIGDGNTSVNYYGSVPPW